MKITRLEIFGFKSFVDRFSLNFDRNFVGVVGPNGCGKSNIVDALRWVLGETHAKQLRGGVLEDLIFNGSESRRPLGMAEVSISIRTEQDWQPSHLIQAAATRTNGDLSAAAERSENSDHNPQTDAELEAAGISSLMEIPGLFESAEIQLTRRLYRSGESEYFINRIPCRLRDMIELYRIIGLGARGLSIVQQGQIGEIISKKPVERRELLEEAAGISGFRARMEAAQRKLERSAQNMARLDDIITEVDRQTKSLRRQAKRAEQRAELKNELKELDLKLFELKTSKVLVEEQKNRSRHQILTQERELAKNKIDIARVSQEKQRAKLEEFDVELIDIRRKRNELSTRLEAGRMRQNELQLQLTKTQSQIDSGRERSLELKERQQQLLDELSECRSTLEELDLDQLSSEKREQISANALESSQPLKIQSKDTLEQLAHQQGKLNNLQLELVRIEAESKSISEQLQADTLRFTEQPEAIKALDLLGDGLRFSDQHRQAVTAVLGERLNFLICDDSLQLASDLSDKLGKYQSALFGVIEKKAGENLKPLLSAVDLVEFDGVVSVDQLVESLPGFSGAAKALLQNAFLVRSIEQGIALQKMFTKINSSGAEIVAVTPVGEVITAWGWYKSPEQGAQRILEQRQAELAAELAQKRSELSEVEILVSDLQLKDQSLQKELAAIEQIEQSNALRNAKDEAVRGFQTARISQLESDLESIEQRLNNTINNVSELESEKEALGSAFEQSLADESSSNSAAELEKEFVDVQNTMRELEQQRDSISRALAESSQEVDLARRGLDQLSDEYARLEVALEKAQLESSMLTEDIQRYYPDHGQLPDIDSANRALLELETDCDKHCIELAEQAQKLRKRIEREGEVDPESVERYREESERLETLKTQQEDLLQATRTLERTIRQLKDISRQRFVETFADVKEKFEDLIPRLFGGGSGYLELINPEDPLTSGVELTVRPPGKKLKSMELLSGGEKALVATGLLFAMFLHRPSPICVLDEVDAPLDDANLERFLSLVTEIASNTQFLVITHNKQTMAAADRLIGITMQESGVSTALSVDFEQAEEEIEKWVANA